MSRFLSHSGPEESDVPPTKHPWLAGVTGVAIVLVAFNLRTPITSLGAVLSDIRADLAMTSGMAGFLTSVPVLMFAAVGSIVPWLGRSLSTTRIVTVSLVLLTAGTWTRTLAGIGILVVGTVIATAGIAMINVLLPVIVRSSFPRRQGWLTGLYVSVMSIGAAVASAVTVLLAAGTGGWRVGLAWWAVPAGIAILVWIAVNRAMSGRAQPDGPDSGLTWPRLFRDRTTIALTVLFGIQSMAFYTVAGWLPTVLRDVGMTAEQAGVNMGIAMTVMVPAALITPAWVATLEDQRRFVPVVAMPWLIGMGGLLLAPTTLTFVWMVMIGLGMTSFPVALLLVGMRTASAADTKHVSAFVQSIGYLLAVPGPLLFGVLFDATGSWTIPLLILTATIIPIAWAGRIGGRDVLIGRP